MIEADESLFKRVIGMAIEVHRVLGPGLLESVYELALAFELGLAGIHVERQKEISVEYKGQPLGIGFRADLIVDGSLVLELKATDRVAEFHAAQLMSYLRLLNIKRGLLINFNAMPLKNGIRRISI